MKLMRRLSLVSVILFSLTALFQQSFVLAQETQKSQPPQLPEFTKEPYLPVLLRYQPKIHPEWGDVKGLLFDDSEDVSNRKNRIMIFFNEDGSYRYAEWVSLGKEPGTFLVKGFTYDRVTKKFVFEREIIE